MEPWGLSLLCLLTAAIMSMYHEAWLLYMGSGDQPQLVMLVWFYWLSSSPTPSHPFMLGSRELTM